MQQKRRSGGSKQDRLLPAFQQSAMQPQRLPLAAAHFAAGIEVEDAHKL
jgi:hypothetical protein